MERWGWRSGIVCVCVSVCVQFFSTPLPISPSVLPHSAMLLPSISIYPSPHPISPFPLPSSPFHLDEKILILMALRLFFFFFATQQWCDGLSYMPHGCSFLIGGLSRHIYTRTCTRSCTRILSHMDTGNQGLDFVWFPFPPWLSPPLPPPWLLSTHPHTGNAVTLSTSSPHTLSSFFSPLFFLESCGVSQFMGLACWRVFAGGDLMRGGLKWG